MEIRMEIKYHFEQFLNTLKLEENFYKIVSIKDTDLFDLCS
jgi:hypothetical protein